MFFSIFDNSKILSVGSNEPGDTNDVDDSNFDGGRNDNEALNKHRISGRGLGFRKSHRVLGRKVRNSESGSDQLVRVHLDHLDGLSSLGLQLPDLNSA